MLDRFLVGFCLGDALGQGLARGDLAAETAFLHIIYGPDLPKRNGQAASNVGVRINATVAAALPTVDNMPIFSAVFGALDPWTPCKITYFGE